MELQDVITQESASVIDALKVIDANKLGFVIAVDEQEVVQGILTDGDIRRALITGRSIDSSVGDIVNRDFISFTVNDQFDDVIEHLKTEKIKFIPVLDEQGKLANVITRAATHALLLKNVYPDLSYDFLNVDGSIINHEIFGRPWGFYKTTILNDMFQSKIISVKPNASLSLQMHHKREEHWVIVHGKGKVILDDSELDVKDGSYIYIPKGCKHRISNESSDDTLIFIEVQCGQYFGEDDIVRFEDQYGRV